MAILKSSGASSAKTPVIKGPAPAAKALAADIKKTNNLLNNANTRESRTGIVGIGTPAPIPVITTGKDTKLPNKDITEIKDPYVPPPAVLPPLPLPPTAKDLGVVKMPGRDVTRISDLVQQTPSDVIKRIAFEKLSAVELSQVLTSGTVDGVNQKYSIISNLSDVRKRFDASKQLSIMNKLAPMTSVFTIDINSKVPGIQYLINNGLNEIIRYLDINGTNTVEIEKGYVYIDTNGDLIIEFENIKDDEIAQIQINSDGTMYEVT